MDHVEGEGPGGRTGVGGLRIDRDGPAVAAVGRYHPVVVAAGDRVIVLVHFRVERDGHFLGAALPVLVRGPAEFVGRNGERRGARFGIFRDGNGLVVEVGVTAAISIDVSERLDPLVVGRVIRLAQIKLGVGSLDVSAALVSDHGDIDGRVESGCREGVELSLAGRCIIDGDGSAVIDSVAAGIRGDRAAGDFQNDLAIDCRDSVRNGNVVADLQRIIHE